MASLCLQLAAKRPSQLTATTRAVTRAFSSAKTPIVNSHNEWDPLEEVIVGRVEGATIPEWHVSGKAVWPQKWWEMYQTKSGRAFPQELMDNAAKELDYLAEVLRGEGVIVRRPEAKTGDFDKPVETPDFRSKSQLYAAMPRDVLIVFGNEILEAPMAWRSRYFEFRPYRKLIKEYFQVHVEAFALSFVVVVVIVVWSWISHGFCGFVVICRKEPSGRRRPSPR